MPYKDRRGKEYRDRIRPTQQSWYERHKEHQVRTALERKLRMRDIYQEIKSNLRCADCGETHPATLHFHHRNPAEKEFSISEWVWSGKSLDKLEKELAKCIVLCANCHAKRHFDANQKEKQPDLGLAGDMRELVKASKLTPDEERLYNAMFGSSGDVEQEYQDYQTYYGVDPRNRE